MVRRVGHASIDAVFLHVTEVREDVDELTGVLLVRDQRFRDPVMERGVPARNLRLDLARVVTTPPSKFLLVSALGTLGPILRECERVVQSVGARHLQPFREIREQLRGRGQVIGEAGARKQPLELEIAALRQLVRRVGKQECGL